MLCPLCKIEARISKSAYVIRDNKLYMRFEYSCRNKECSNYDKVIGEEESEVEAIVEAPKPITEEVEEPTENIDEEASE